MTLCSNVERSVSAGRLADDELSVRVKRVVAPRAAGPSVRCGNDSLERTRTSGTLCRPRVFR